MISSNSPNNKACARTLIQLQNGASDNNKLEKLRNFINHRTHLTALLRPVQAVDGRYLCVCRGVNRGGGLSALRG